MLPPPGELLRDHLIPAKNISAEVRRRISPSEFMSVQTKKIPEMESDGWVVDKRNKKSVRMRKAKPHDIAFEDKVWSAFAKLQFNSLNIDRHFKIRYGDAPGDTQQVDVFAANDEVVIVVECKSAESPKKHQFKKEIEAITGQRPGMIRTIQKEYPNHKIKFVLATNNYDVTSADTQERFRAADVVHLDDEAIDYYLGLADHLGRAARYQILGSLFAGTKIPNLQPEVVAIEAKMGGHKYYSFSIEPDRLLKLAYVLHRNTTNANLMPTYQRLIKKSRLKNVAQFVDNGGYFPNSLILSLDAPRGLRFEPFPRHYGSTRAGILHLPSTFRAAYVIDGQHRLYGYADSDRASTDLIPVVAFLNLARADQVKLFMQINENQQAVPKNLRNTLNADLLWESADLREQIRSLKLNIAQRLGEDRGSPLLGRVLVGENPQSSIRCLTIEAISRGIDRGHFLGSFTRTEVRELGTFYRGSNNATVEPLLDYLKLGLNYFKDGLETQFRLGRAEGGFVFINTGVESMIRILGDVAHHVVAVNNYNPREIETADLFAEVIPYLDPAIAMLSGFDTAAGLEFRQMYGSTAGTKYWRRLQQSINESRPDFSPVGLKEYLESEVRQFNDESRVMVAELESFLKQDIRTRLEDEFGSTWFRRGAPRKIWVDAGTRAVEKNADRTEDDELEPWDCVFLINYRDILVLTEDLWKRLFEKRYTRPGDEEKSGRKARTEWLVKLNEIRNDVFHARPVSEEDHNFLVTLTTWLVRGQDDNNL